MMYSQYGKPIRLTSTGSLSTDGARLMGFYVASTSSGTIVLRDGGASGTQISGTITPAVGFHWFPAASNGALHATIANTLDVTFFVN
jgi:hypothetical protein